MLIERIPKQLDKVSSMAKVGIRLVPLVVFVAVNNLSTAIIILGIAVCMLFVASPKYKEFFVVAVLGVLFIFAFINTASYRSDRVEAWKHPETAGDKGYQTMQALYAIGSGKLFGKGLGQSLQKLGNVPEAQNDMIFSIICEELGLFGAVCVILLFVLMLWRMMVIANNAKGSVRGTSGDGHYVTYCDSGSFKYCGCYQYDSEYRCHSAVYQLRRYLACIPYGRDGACAERVEGHPSGYDRVGLS